MSYYEPRAVRKERLDVILDMFATEGDACWDRIDNDIMVLTLYDLRDLPDPRTSLVERCLDSINRYLIKQWRTKDNPASKDSLGAPVPVEIKAPSLAWWVLPLVVGASALLGSLLGGEL